MSDKLVYELTRSVESVNDRLHAGHLTFESHLVRENDLLIEAVLVHRGMQGSALPSVAK